MFFSSFKRLIRQYGLQFMDLKIILKLLLTTAGSNSILI